MIILGRIIIPPIRFCKTTTTYGDKPNLTIRWHKSGMAGTMKSTSYTFEICTRENKYQYAFVWRPDVTRYWWADSKKKAINATGESESGKKIPTTRQG